MNTTHTTARRSRALPRIVVGAAALAIALAPGVASAHIEPAPAAVEAGTAATVSFTVEHGCEGSPTIELRFQIPENVTNAAPVDKDGWTGAADGRVLSFTGGLLDPETSDSFEISFIAPTDAQTLHFPVVQACEAGEIAWIEIPADGANEPDHPAPAVLVTDGPPTSDEATGSHDEDEGGGEHDGHHGGDDEDSAAAEDDGVSGGLIAAGVGAVVIVVAAGILISRRRRDTTG